MQLPSVRTLKGDAAYAMGRAREPRKLILVYAGINVLLALALTLVSGWLSTQIEGTGGLHNIGIRSILSTAKSVLPMIEAVIMGCLTFGYLHGMMRLARGKYADHTDLKAGFQKIFPMLRLTLLQSFRFLSLAFVVFYFSMMLFLSTSWSDPLAELLLPLMESAGSNANVVAMMDEAMLNQAYTAMIPMLVLFAALYLIVAVPMFYRLRLSTYVLLDDPQGRALLAMRQSTQMMRGNMLRMLKLDLSFWWYYLLIALASLIAYGDTVLSMLGVTLPINSTAAFYLFYILYLAMLFAIYYFLRNRVEMTYVKAYDSLVEKPREDGVVLGNIFDL